MYCNNCCPDENGGNGNNQTIFTDKFCCEYNLICNNAGNDDRFVWQSIQAGTTFPVAGTVSVSYDNGCADFLIVNIRLGGKAGTIVGTLTIPQPQGAGAGSNCQAITLKEFDTLEIICGDSGNNRCNGEFCLTIHYPSPFST
jgi:hypothetical protein